MMRILLKSKIHRATVTEADVNYSGSVGIDKDLLDRVDIVAGEKVLIVDLTNGARMETYVIEEIAGSGTICMNGGTAHLSKVGNKVCIMAFGLSDKEIKAKKILVDDKNKYLREI